MANEDYILGLDLGTRSLGWAAVGADRKRVCGIGVRVFEAGADPVKFAVGRTDSSNAAERRRARLQRRQTRRRAARQSELFALLQFKGLLPGASTGRRTSPEVRQEILHGPARSKEKKGLDHELLRRVRAWYPEVQQVEHVMPYLLRARALDHRLEPEELGRALYSLGQRRGYESNRKAGRGRTEGAVEGAASPRKRSKRTLQEPANAEEETGRVLAGIADLDRRMKDKNARTLGEYFANCNPLERRVRGEYTARQMFKHEFEAIWDNQAEYADWQELLGDARFKGRVYRLLFYQRPVATNKHLIGRCRLERTKRRAPTSCLEAQQFRVLQKVNDITVIDGLDEWELSSEDRSKLADELGRRAEMSCRQIRDFLGISGGAHLNLERAAGKLNPERKVKGNRTASHMRQVFGSGWKEFTDNQKNEIVQRWMDEQDGPKLVEWAQQRLGLSADQARMLASKEAEDGYSKLSLEALRKLLPLMERGVPFKTAEEDRYGNSFSGNEKHDFLPPLCDVLPHVPNPAVRRALTELRKTVNAIIRKFGKKPREIRIELARDLKRNMEQRRLENERMERDATERKRLRKLISIKLGIDEEQVKPADIEKVRLWRECGAEIEKLKLWEECKGICPYTGKSIAFSDLFGSPPRFDVEHILPKRRFADDSFQNKTLCDAEFNRKYKAGWTPFEACGPSNEWDGILERVRKMGNREKLRRFQITTEEELEKFSARALNDTRYASTLAADYVGALYGGRDEEMLDSLAGTKRRVRRVYVSTGISTAALRRAWQLEAVVRHLFPKPRPNQPAKRSDHRHHAIDAVVIALTSQGVVQRMSGAAAAFHGARGAERVTSRYVEAPWQDFVSSIEAEVSALKVSHRPKRKLNGKIDDANTYAVARGLKRQEVHKRKFVWELTAAQINAEKLIVDGAIAAAVKAKLSEIGDPKKFKDSPPALRTKKGEEIPIRKVRIHVPVRVVTVANGVRERNVSLAENHHIPIFIVRDENRREKWDSPGVVSRKDALDRWQDLKETKSKDNLVRHSWPHDDAPRRLESEFLFSLMPGDTVEMDDSGGRRKDLFIVRTISEEASGDVEIDLVRHSEARRLEDLKRVSFKDFRKGQGSELIRIRSVDQLRVANCRKIAVDPLMLGQPHYAYD